MHDVPQFQNISCAVNLLSAISNKYIYMTFCFHKYYSGLKPVIVNIKIEFSDIPTDAHAGKVWSTCWISLTVANPWTSTQNNNSVVYRPVTCDPEDTK